MFLVTIVSPCSRGPLREGAKSCFKGWGLALRIVSALFERRPADAVEGIDQRRSSDLEASADRCLAGTAVEGGGDLFHLLGIDGGGTPSPATATLGSGETGGDPLAGQGAFVLRQRAEEGEQQLSVRRVRVHMFGQRAERDAAFLQIGDDGQKVGKRPTEPVELPHDEAVALLQVGQTGFQGVFAGEGEILPQARKPSLIRSAFERF